jgi:hypothetical protein
MHTAGTHACLSNICIKYALPQYEHTYLKCPQETSVSQQHPHASNDPHVHTIWGHVLLGLRSEAIPTWPTPLLLPHPRSKGQWRLSLMQITSRVGDMHDKQDETKPPDQYRGPHISFLTAQGRLACPRRSSGHASISTDMCRPSRPKWESPTVPCAHRACNYVSKYLRLWRTTGVHVQHARLPHPAPDPSIPRAWKGEYRACMQAALDGQPKGLTNQQTNPTNKPTQTNQTTNRPTHEQNTLCLMPITCHAVPVAVRESRTCKRQHGMQSWRKESTAQSQASCLLNTQAHIHTPPSASNILLLFIPNNKHGSTPSCLSKHTHNRRFTHAMLVVLAPTCDLHITLQVLTTPAAGDLTQEKLAATARTTLTVTWAKMHTHKARAKIMISTSKHTRHVACHTPTQSHTSPRTPPCVTTHPWHPAIHHPAPTITPSCRHPGLSRQPAGTAAVSK